jgi:putative hydrolase of the HAD superfamily
MKGTQAILFDVGGTLVQGEMPWTDLYAQALALTAHPMPLREMVSRYEAAIGRMTRDKHMPVAPEAVTVSHEPAKVRNLNSYLAEEFGLSESRLQQAVDEVIFDHPEARHLVCVDGARGALSELRRRGYRLAVISNWSADLPLVLARLGLKHHFEAIFASEALGYAKPNPAAFLVPLDRLGLTPGGSVYVGDLYQVDVVGSREVGLTPILTDPLGLGLHDDVTTVSRLSELLELFGAP